MTLPLAHGPLRASEIQVMRILRWSVYHDAAPYFKLEPTITVNRWALRAF